MKKIPREEKAHAEDLSQETKASGEISSWHRVIFFTTNELPCDSIDEITCKCGASGVFQRVNHCVDKGSYIQYWFRCPECKSEIPHYLGFRFGERAVLNFKVWARNLRKKVRARSRLITIVAAITIVITFAAIEYPIFEGYRVFKEEGPLAILDWVQDPRTNQEKFLEAWSLYSTGDLVGAKEKSKHLLKLKADSKVKGDAYFLTSLLASQDFSSDTMGLYQQTLDIYSKVGAFNSIYNTYLSIANHLLVQDDTELAYHFLKKTYHVPASNPNLGYYHEVESDFFFKSGQYEDALSAAEISLENYQGKDVIATARLLHLLGFYLILTGDQEAGLGKSIESEILCLKIGNMDLYYYNMFNFFLIAKCNGMNALAYRDIIKNKSKETGDKLLGIRLEFAENFICGPKPPEKGGDNEPPIPPPDQKASQ